MSHQCQPIQRIQGFLSTIGIVRVQKLPPIPHRFWWRCLPRIQINLAGVFSIGPHNDIPHSFSPVIHIIIAPLFFPFPVGCIQMDLAGSYHPNLIYIQYIHISRRIAFFTFLSCFTAPFCLSMQFLYKQLQRHIDIFFLHFFIRTNRMLQLLLLTVWFIHFWIDLQLPFYRTIFRYGHLSAAFLISHGIAQKVCKNLQHHHDMTIRKDEIKNWVIDINF